MRSKSEMDSTKSFGERDFSDVRDEEINDDDVSDN
jgi:hypothetical protein